MAIGWLTVLSVLSSIVSFKSKKHSDLPPISTANFKYKNFKYKNIIVIYIYIYIYILELIYLEFVFTSLYLPS